MIGKLLSETDRSGRTTSYSYDTSDRVVRIIGPFGHSLTLGYGTNYHLTSITNDTSQVISYTYDTNNNLTRVDYPDNTAKLYHYNETGLTSGANLPNHLTGISYVSAGVTTRYATYTYDTNGKAIRTEHAQTDNGSAQERFTLAYNSATQTTVTDPIGMNEVMTFATNLGVKNLTLKVNQRDSKSVAQVFDANNNLTCKKDEENRVTLYSYNATNQKTSMTEGLSGGDCNTCLANPANCNAGGVARTTTYEYLSTTLDLPRFIRRPSVATDQTFETEIQYGDAGHPNLPTQITQRGYTPAGAAISRSVSFGYNTAGQVNVINGPRIDVNDVTTLEYYACTTGGACGQLMRITNALGHITTYDNYDANGRLLQMTDPNGLRTAYSYDERGRVKTVTQAPASAPNTLCVTTGNTCWQYRYTPWGDVSQVIDPDGVVLNYSYDAAHDLRTITDGAGNQIRYQYDLKGNRTEDDRYNSNGALKRSVGYAYDLRNRVTAINLAGKVTSTVYDAAGNLLSETDPNTHVTSHGYDALNRLYQSVQALNELNEQTSYGYDVNDRPTTVTAPNNLTTQYSYDDLGNRLKEISPDRGPTNYTYDAAGNVMTVKDARNITTSYTYDALHRVTAQQSSLASTPGYAYVYDECGAGRLCRITRNGAAHLLFGYDDFNRRISTLDFSTFLNTSYGYTLGGRLSELNYPDGNTVTYQYDSAGQVRQVSNPGTVLADGIKHAPFGPITGFSFGNGESYSVTFNRAYYPTLRVDGAFLENIQSYDGNYNLTQRATVGGESFTYDARDRLASATAGHYGSLSYRYDGNGNRQSETRNGTVTAYTYTPANSNKLTQVGESDYRTLGAGGYPLWTSALYNLTFDGYGRMTSALTEAATYTYNALDQRTKKTAGGVTTAFAYGPQGELLYEVSGGNRKAYVYLDGVPLARMDNSNQIYYYHNDHLGAPQILMDSMGAPVWQASYEPFGQAAITIQTIKNNVRLAGMYADSETGLYYWGARYYDPRTGRGLSADRRSVGKHVQEWLARLGSGKPNQPPLELNPYVYAANNPLRWIDPTGEANVAPEYGGGSSTSTPYPFDIPPYVEKPLSLAEQAMLATTLLPAIGPAARGVQACYKVGVAAARSEAAKRACLALGICSATARGEDLDDYIRDVVTREQLRRSSEIAQQQTRTLVK